MNNIYHDIWIFNSKLQQKRDKRSLFIIQHVVVRFYVSFIVINMLYPGFCSVYNKTVSEAKSIFTFEVLIPLIKSHRRIIASPKL